MAEIPIREKRSKNSQALSPALGRNAQKGANAVPAIQVPHLTDFIIQSATSDDLPLSALDMLENKA
jgi:hypothetical protein